MNPYLTLTELPDGNLQLALTEAGADLATEYQAADWNDHDILRNLLGSLLVIGGGWEWANGDTIAMHGSFLLAHGSLDNNDDPYWYDNYYAIRDIIKDLLADYKGPVTEYNGYRTITPRPVILWRGPKNEEEVE